MTRETKVGIVVASAFVLLIAGVLAYKIYVLGEGMPAVADAAVSQPVPEATSPAPPSTVQATRQAQPPQPEPPTQQNTAQIPEVGASLEIVGPFLLDLHDNVARLADASAQGFIYLTSKHEDPATSPVPRAKAPEAAAQPVAANPPMPQPPVPEAPVIEAPTAGTSPSPRASGGSSSSGGAPQPKQSPPQTAPPAVDTPNTKPPETVKNVLPGDSATRSEPPAMRTPDSLRPPTPPTDDTTAQAADSRQPEADSQSASNGTNGSSPAASLAQPQAKPATPEKQPQPPPAKPSTGGIPVTIREQPDLPLPATPAAPPAPSAPAASAAPAVAAPPAPRNPGGPSTTNRGARVEDYDVVIHDVQPGDTYADISKNTYGSDRYQAALAAFNHELDPQNATLSKGQRLRVPPALVLERRYRSLIPGLPEPPPEPSVKGPVQILTPRQPARLMSNIGPEQTAPALGAPVPNVNAALPPNTSAKDAAQANWAKDTKQYRVQPNDTIWSIAKHTLGKGERWPEISRLNRDVLPDVNQLKAGMTLRLPAEAKVDTPETPQ